MLFRSTDFSLFVFQVIKAFGNSEFFNMVFPLLFDLYNPDLSKSVTTPVSSDSAEAGYDNF